MKIELSEAELDAIADALEDAMTEIMVQMRVWKHGERYDRYKKRFEAMMSVYKRLANVYEKKSDNME